jgi:membrane-associated phospholipid phosphatase
MASTVATSFPSSHATILALGLVCLCRFSAQRLSLRPCEPATNQERPCVPELLFAMTPDRSE